MVNAAENKRTGGRVSLDLHNDRNRRRVFLHRNLVQALKWHERQLQATNASNGDMFTDGMLSESSDNLTWRFPNKDMLERLVHKRKAVLKVDIKAFQSYVKTSTEALIPSDHSHKRIKLLPIPVQFELKVWETHTQNHRLVRHDVQNARINLSQDENSKPHFDVEMFNPFSVDIDQLFVTLERGPRWKRTIALAYTAQISVTLLEYEDADILLPRLFTREGLVDNRKRVPQIVAKWMHLPKCPPAGHVLSLTGIFGDERCKSDYGLEIDMAWKTSEVTPLVEYNRALRVSQNTELPSPVSEPGHEQSVRVMYVFKDDYVSSSLSITGCLCPLCNRRDFKTYERLHFHLVTDHDYFKFTMHKSEPRLECDAEVVVTFEAELADRFESRPSIKPLDKVELSWTAPEQAFDVSKYLEGDDGWIATGLDDKRKLRVPRTNIVLVRTAERRKPEDITDLPDMNRTKYRVPAAPEGLGYFTTIGKRPLSEGEMINESDDEINESWLKLKRHRAVSNSGVSESARDFLKGFDDYFQGEQLSGDRYAGDALVRFVRIHRRWLSKPSMAKEFERKATELRDDRIVTDAVFTHCMDLIPSYDETIEDEMDETADKFAGSNNSVFVNRVNGGSQNDKMNRKVLNAILKLSPWRGRESSGVKKALGYGRRSTQNSNDQSVASPTKDDLTVTRLSTNSPQEPNKRRGKSLGLCSSVPNGDSNVPSTKDADGDIEMTDALDHMVHFPKMSHNQAMMWKFSNGGPGRCVCGNAVCVLRTAISCANHVSSRRTMHIL